MTAGSRILTAVFALSLGLAWVFPMWTIELEAPQYPEGLGMEIWINRLSGDINTINGLNHYIGMQQINEQSIPELKWMPWFLGLIIVAGLIAALAGRKIVFTLWVALFGILGTVAAFDFYSWEYDYGHTLDPAAAIKIPGMSYQPPLLGSKQLLNFTAHSYPGAAGMVIMGNGIALLVMLIMQWTKRKKVRPAMLLLLTAVALSSCSKGPVPVKYGHDSCIRCSMIIADNRFGAEIVTKKGKVFYFDSIECLLRYYQSKAFEKHQAAHILMTDADQPGQLIPAGSAFYLQSEKYPSPMGENLSAFGSRETRDRYHREFGGNTYSWDELLALYAP